MGWVVACVLAVVLMSTSADLLLGPTAEQCVDAVTHEEYMVVFAAEQVVEDHSDHGDHD